MKIAITTSGSDLNSPLEIRFGRSPRFLIYDVKTDKFEIIDNNQNLNLAQGAGIQAAQHVARQGVHAVITGHCGPKAFRVLKEAGIKIYTCKAETVREAINLYRSGKLEETSSANAEGHW